MKRSTSHQRNLRRAGAAAALCTAVSVIPLAAQAAPGAGSAAGAATAGQATITVSTSGKVTGDLSNQFMGLSFEESTIDNGYRYDAIGNLPQLLKNLGTPVMRFGGNTADTSYVPATTKELAALARLTKATGWSVLWTEGLAHYSAAEVTADAKRVSAELGSHLYAFACGNEPDMYSYDDIRAASYTIDNYLSQVNTCYNAIRAGDRKAPLEGPDTAWNPAWLSAFAAKYSGIVKTLGQHYYPLGCAKAGENAATAAGTLLSPGLARTEGEKLGTYLAAAKTAKAPLRITETNSACSGGVKGMSNAYATSLWVIDYMLLAAQRGVAGMNFHGGLNTLCAGYTVLCQTGTDSYTPQPIYYGMLFARLFGTGGFLPVKLATSKTQDIAAFADKPAKDGSIRVMVENMGAQTSDTTLKLSGYKGSVRVLRLTGGSPLATTGIKIQGATVAADGKLSPGKPDTVSCPSGTCRLTIAPYSAALVTLNEA